MKQVPVVFQIISYVHGEKNLKTIFIWIIRVYRYIGHCVQTDPAKHVWTRAYLRDRPFNLQGGGGGGYGFLFRSEFFFGQHES